MEILPIGSVVRLNNGDIKLMVISRAPLHNQDGVIGYFDYSACIYPQGQTEQQAYFFNQKDIEEVYFKGYEDEQEKLFKEKYKEEIKKVPYPKFEVNEEHK